MAKATTTTTTTIADAVADQLAQRAAFGAVLGESSPLIAKADKAILGELKAGETVKSAMWGLVIGLRDLGVPAQDAGAIKIVGDVLNEHIGNLGDDSPAGKKWAQWVRPLKQAIYHAIPEAEFGLGLRNRTDDYPLPSKNGKVGKSGKVSTTTLNAVFVTASKMIDQLRLLGDSQRAAELVDWMTERWDTFQEVDADGKPVAAK